MKKILVPVDFSETSKNALRYATKLFDQKDLEITILNVYGAESTALLMKSIDNVLIDDATHQINKIIAELQEDNAAVVFKTKLLKNYPVSTIASLGNSGDYDFVVMGTKGVSGLKEVFMGSVAGGVISKTSAPVIVVPLEYNFNAVKKIVLAMGKNEVSNTTNLEPLRKIVEYHNSDLEVFHIYKDNQPDLESELQGIKDLNPKFTYKDADNGDLNRYLNAHINSSDSDLLCLIRTKKDFLDRIFSESVTLKQSFNSTVPLLIIQE